MQINKNIQLKISLRCVEAKSRFNATEIMSERDRVFQKEKNTVYEDLHTRAEIVFTCGHCHSPMQFKKDDFIEQDKNKKTNLRPNDDTRFSAMARLCKLDKLSFIDYYCPTCKSPFRAYYGIFYGGYDPSLSIKKVVEYRKAQ